MQKNVAGQKFTVFAWDLTTGDPVTGDAANITGKVRKDWGSPAAIADTNPTEVEDGFYDFDATQAESNADDILVLPESATANVQVIGVPAHIRTVAAGSQSTNIASGTIGSTGNSTTALHLTGLTFADGLLRNYLIEFTDVSTGLTHQRWITNWVNSTALATISPALPASPQNATDTYRITRTRRVFVPEIISALDTIDQDALLVSIVLRDQHGVPVDPTTVGSTIAGTISAREHLSGSNVVTVDGVAFDHTDVTNGTFEVSIATPALNGGTIDDFYCTVTIDGIPYPGKNLIPVIAGPAE